MKCSKCGKKVKSNLKFCTYCGNYVGETNDNSWEIGGDLLEEEAIKTEDNTISTGKNKKEEKIEEKKESKKEEKKEEEKPIEKTVEQILDEREEEEEERALLDDEKFKKIELTEEEAKRINPPIPVEEKKETKKEENFFDDKDLNDREFEPEKITVKDNSGTGTGEYAYEHEDLLEAYIGEDYKIIKKMPINIWAFLLNWMYLLYRKLYITGIVGLIISWLAVVFIRPFILYYIGAVMVILGFAFNKYYIFIAKKRVEKIISNSEDDDKFVLASTCKEKGGVNVPNALLIYFVFLIAIFFSLVTITINKTHNPKFFEENSANEASCRSIIKTAKNSLEEEEAKVGKISDAVCKVINGKEPEYEVYIKTEKDNTKYYNLYVTEKGYVKYKSNTIGLAELQIRSTNGQLGDAERKIFTEKKSIELNYQEIFNKAKSEDDLIKRKKNKEPKTNFIFTPDEVIQIG